MNRNLRNRNVRSLPALAAATLLLALPLAARPAEAASAEGFLYGKVTTRGGTTYQGRLRWGKEEAFWGDHFNSSKRDRPHAERAPRHLRDRREPIEVFGVEIGVRWNDNGGRQFVARYGDIKTLEVGRGDRVTAIMKDGTEVDLDGGSNDIGADITVWDSGAGRISLDWEEIDRIDFLATPRDLAVDVTRLHGVVDTDAGQFRGFVQWDLEECVSTDELDGETRDGEVSIEMGRIQSIERRTSRSSRVTLRDGRELELDGTNDVNDENRGIFVEDDRFGRVEISWDAFEKVVFSDPGPSGPAYDDFAPGEPLHGTVVADDGTQKGRLVYDLDEEHTWELLDGSYRDVEYHIPFDKVVSITRDGHRGSKVKLASGEEVRLEEAADVDDDNSGIAVLAGGAEREPGSSSGTQYIDWEDVERIDFD